MNHPLSAQDVIHLLDLLPLDGEGGFFRQTYKCQDSGLSEWGAKRHFGTAIYYLVTPENFSALHRVKNDELFHFYAGDAVEMFQLSPGGEANSILIGNDLKAGQRPQVLVPRNFWQGVKLLPGGSWALLGATVSPGFEYEDFELGMREALSRQYPQHCAKIQAYTKA
ncbi:MAG TPA: cupin domain-containing protein [Bdellovibrionota bacterium]